MGERLVDEPGQAELGPQGIAISFKNDQGLQLWRYLWPVHQAKGVIFAVHGLGSYAANILLKKKAPGDRPIYQNSIAEELNRRGYSVAAVDLQGHGRSEGLMGRRAYFNEFNDLVNDLALAAEETKRQLISREDLPMFLLGASMGGCLAVHLLNMRGDLFAGASLLAPMLSVESMAKTGINRVYAVIGNMLNFLVPSLPLLKMKKPEKYPEIQEFYERDPIVFKGLIRVRVAFQCVKAIEWVQQNRSEFAFPFLIIHGTEDTLCDPEGSHAFYMETPSSDKTLHMAQKMWHFLLSEPGHEKVIFYHTLPGFYGYEI